MAADGISWLTAQIDWRFVAATIWDCLKVIAALAITAYSLTCDAISVDQTINWDLPAAPAINPLFEVAAELEQPTAKQLKAITGSRRRVAKRELVAAYIAY